MRLLSSIDKTRVVRVHLICVNLTVADPEGSLQQLPPQMSVESR